MKKTDLIALVSIILVIARTAKFYKGDTFDIVSNAFLHLLLIWSVVDIIVDRKREKKSLLKFVVYQHVLLYAFLSYYILTAEIYPEKVNYYVVIPCFLIIMTTFILVHLHAYKIKKSQILKGE